MAASDGLREALAQHITVGLVGQPNSLRLTWNEAQAVAWDIARRFDFASTEPEERRYVLTAGNRWVVVETFVRDLRPGEEVPPMPEPGCPECGTDPLTMWGHLETCSRYGLRADGVKETPRAALRAPR